MSVSKVPIYIKNKMHRVAKMNKEASEIMDEIEFWLNKNGIDTGVEGLRDGCGTGLEELECGYDCVEELCERIENFETWVPPDVF